MPTRDDSFLRLYNCYFIYLF